MRKALIIALTLSVATLAAPAAQADSSPGARIIAQEKAKHVVIQPAPPTAVEQLIAQERGRQADGRLFGTSNPAPVVIAGAPDGFDVGDAGIGSAATLALALLAAAGLAVRSSRRRGSAGVAPAGN